MDMPEELPYLCLDSVYVLIMTNWGVMVKCGFLRNLTPCVCVCGSVYSYMYSLLVDGIGLDADTKFVMEKKIRSGGKDFEAAWSLGMAMEIL